MIGDAVAHHMIMTDPVCHTILDKHSSSDPRIAVMLLEAVYIGKDRRM